MQKLERWEISPKRFREYCFTFISAGVLLDLLASYTALLFGVRGGARTVLAIGGSHLGVILGMYAFARLFPRDEPEVKEGSNNSLLDMINGGVGTFLLSLPAVIFTGLFWGVILRLSHVETAPRKVLGMFTRLESPVEKAAFVFVLVVTGPITEELIFRRVFFRYLRTRFPRWLAYGLPALIFAVLHLEGRTHNGLGSLPQIFVSALIFSRAYERTGQIAVPMIAHGLNNLFSLVVFSAFHPR